MFLAKEKIKESFSKAAFTYDEAGGFQKEIGLRLIDRILSEKVYRGKVLDVGMGTGSVTQELVKILNSRVYGCDLSWGMVSFSKRNTKDIFISQAEAENLPFKKETFDLVFSNITYQWVRDFKLAFLEVRRILKKEGRFWFSVLVKDSLKELYEILDIFFDMDLFTPPLRARAGFVDFLPGSVYINQKLKESDFNIIWLKDMILKRHYNSCLDLLKSLKMVGAGRVLDSNLFGMGKRKLFFEMLDAYDVKFREGDKIFATYKVVLGCVEK